jgi:CSLREA domain-containing protein
MTTHVLGLGRMRALGLAITLTLLTGLLIVAAPPPAAHAGTFTVTTTDDTDDEDPTNCDPSGVCPTLRDAVAAANDDSDESFIELAPGATYQLEHGDLDVLADLTIYTVGARATIEQTGSWGIFRVDTDHFTVNNLVLTGGDAQYGGAIGADHEFDLITVHNSVITDNDAEYGGGIYVDASTDGDGVVRIEGSVISGNTASEEGGGIYAYGFQRMDIIKSTITDNHADWGGGVYVECEFCSAEAEQVFIGGSTFSGNTAYDEGGGAFIWGASDLWVQSSTFDGNEAVYGAAISVWGYGPRSDTEVVNSTFSGNEADTTEHGGALAFWAGDAATDATIVNSTIVDNDGGGLFLEDGPDVAAGNSILEGCEVVASDPVASLGHNIDVGDTCGLDAAGDQTDTDPMLGDLADNAGPTLTRAITPASPAYEAADTDLCPGDDQRGAPRKLPGACDVGAFEYVEGFEDPDKPEKPGKVLDCSTVTLVSFPDVPSSFVHAKNIGCAAGVGLFVGHPDGTFRPQNDVTRAQAASVIFRSLREAGLDVEESPDAAAADTAGSTHQGAIGALTELGVVTNFVDGTFRPSDEVTRAQLASLIARATSELGVEVVASTPTFSDVGPGVHTGNIGWASKAGIVEGYDDDTFRPNNHATRAQTASMLVRWLSDVER